MKAPETDIVIVGAGPVGLMCAYLAQLCGISAIVFDKSREPLQVGRADALNARTLQLLEIVGLFKILYPLGKTCNTSSVWADGKFVSRQSSWWESLEGCLHKHFLMLGQSYIEQLLDAKLREAGVEVRRCSEVVDIQFTEDSCLTTLETGESIHSRFVIGADGSRSLVRERFEVPFEITRPQIVWAVLDAVIETDFPKVPEIIVFQSETSDVAWIPREGDLDRFYIRIDTKEFTLDEAIAKINRAVKPHFLRFKNMVWFSHFSVKESVAERFAIQDRVFLAGDASSNQANSMWRFAANGFFISDTFALGLTAIAGGNVGGLIGRVHITDASGSPVIGTNLNITDPIECTGESDFSEFTNQCSTVYTNWDFTTVWKMFSETNLPILQWQPD